ncbi:MAG: hypothetical protein O3A00_12600 [Planctomycetota bacterium]|nr:hypothetical protein [Planctomycetota bacterium]
MIDHRLTVLAVFASAVLGNFHSANGTDVVQIVHGEHAPKLERFAATELADVFRRVFDDVDVSVSAVAARSSTNVWIGSPTTNPRIAKLVKDWPKTSDQGIVIRSNAALQTHVIGGGSAAATLWAVYEFGHRLGIRSLPRGDIDPLKKRPFKLTDANVVLEPQLKSRTWRTINDFAIGPESWGLEEHKRFLRQLAKLKFNRLMLSVYPWQPFVEYEFGGVKKQTALHWFGEEYRVDGDTVGKKVFLGQKLFENPDFAGLTTSAEQHAAGRKHMQGLIDAAQELGMTVGVSISPLEFPREFQSVLPGSKVAHQFKNLTITPASKQGPHDPLLKQLVTTKIRAYLETYPKLDTLYLTLPEFPEWGQHADAAFRMLQKRGVPQDITVEKLVKAAANRKTTASGKRGEQAVRGNIVALAFFAELFADGKLLQRADGSSVELVITQVDPALYPVLDRVIPKGAGTLSFVDYTARRVVEQRQLLAQVSADKVPSQLIMTLADDNVGLLPQSALQSIGTLTSDLKKLGWDGFSTRYWVPAELDPAVYFLSRSAWTKDLSAEAAFKELWTTATGNPSAVDRLWLAWEHLERATNVIDRQDLGFAFPVPGLLMKHYQQKPIPDWWKEAEDAYTQYMIELYRAHGAIDGGAKHMLFYYAKRGEYVLEYFAAVKAIRAAAIAKQAGDTEKALEHLEAAIEQTYNCINTLSDVARDQSDRGLVAVERLRLPTIAGGIRTAGRRMIAAG